MTCKSACMKSVDVGPAEDFPEGEKRSAELEGELVMLVRYKGKVRALESHCPHQHSSLLFGSIDDGKIVCRMHRASFSLEDGKVLGGPARRDLRTFSVEEKDGRVFLVADQPALE